MAFNLPTPQNEHTSSANTNRGDIGRTSDLSSIKSGGNLPISINASQVINKTGSSANGNPAGVFFGMDGNSSTTTYDATQGSRVFLWSLQYNAPNRIQSSDLANGGSRFWLGSGANPSSNYKEFFIGGNDTPFCASQSGPVTMCIDISDVSNDNTIGSFDPTQISAYGHGSVRRNLVGGSTTQTFFQRSFLFTTTKGSSNIPTFTGVSNFDDAIAVVQGDNYTNKIGSWLTKSGSSFFIPCPFSFGDGVNSVDFNDNGVSIVSPASNSPNQENFRLTNDAMRVYYNPSGIALNNNCVLSGSYSYGTAAKWNFDVDAPHTLSGNFTGMGDITAGSGGVLNGNFNLASGSSVICNGANFDNINVQGDCKILGNSVTDFNGISIDGDLDFDTAGTYNLTSCNVNNITNSSVGNVIINSVNSILSTDNAGTGSGQVSIVSLATLTIEVSESGADVVILEAGTNTVLASVDAQLGTTFEYSYTIVQNIDIGVIKQGFIVNYTYGYSLPTSNSILPINLINDRNYL